jgi:hypothetical protein
MFARLLAGFAVLILMMGQAAAAPPVFSTPQALLDYAYKPYFDGKFPTDDENALYSKSLKALLATATAKSEDEVGPLDFDVFVNGQDYTLSKLKIGDSEPEGQGVKVPVTFNNQGIDESLVFHLIKEGGTWKINDIDCLSPDSEWQMTELLKEAQVGATN